MNPTLANEAPGLESWAPLWVLLGLFALIAVGLAAHGRSRRPGDLLGWVPAGLERLTGIPGWAAGMVGMSWLGLLIAGIGFYNDVAWHIALGRDEVLFTAPHTMIVVGLGFIALSAGYAILAATIGRVETRLRPLGLRVPWSALVMGILGVSALSGFPLDELWHEAYGIDVTMWSPTHLLMIVGASLSPLAGWLALAEAGVRPGDSRWARTVYVAVAWLALAGLSSVQGEFDFGVPQFQQLYHPVLITVAAGIALVAARLVLGAGWTFAIVALAFAMHFGDLLGGTDDLEITNRTSALYIGPAIAVELAALVLGTTKRLRFALASGLGIATIGLGAEWIWNQGAHQPWTAALLPDGALVAGLGAVGAAVIGAALAVALRRDRTGLPWPAVAAGGLAVLVALVLPLPRQTGDVHAAVALEEAGDGEATVQVTVTPAGAADGARWFQASAWQGGGLVLADMEEVSPGVWRSEQPVPVDGEWKTLVRLHRGAEMMAVPVWFPADAEYDKPEIPAIDREMAFAPEQQYLMREHEGGEGVLATAIYGAVLAIAVTWIVAFTVAASRIRRRGSAGTSIPVGESERQPEPVG